MNCLYEMTEKILAEAEERSPGWSRDENLFSKSAILEREILGHMRPIRETIIELLNGRKMIAADAGGQRVERILRR